MLIVDAWNSVTLSPTSSEVRKAISLAKTKFAEKYFDFKQLTGLLDQNHIPTQAAQDVLNQQDCEEVGTDHYRFRKDT